MGKSLVMVENLPREAKSLLSQAGTEIDDLQSTTSTTIDRIQKTTHAQIERLRKQTEKEIARLQTEANQEINTHAEESERKVQARVQQVIADLEPILQSYFQKAKLEETLAIHMQIKQLQENPVGAEPDPGTLTSLTDQVGRTFHFVVTGVKSGSIWGTDVYTSDSLLARAAVHAGKLKVGETKVVRVTIVPPLSSYQGSKRNGVSSSSYGAWGGAYRIE